MLEDLTIVVPTYNRQRFAIRCIEFWSHTKATVIVMDGSKFSIDAEVVKEFGPNVFYNHVPENFSVRIGIAKKLIKTKYTILSGDDEFYIPSGLNSCIGELEMNQELVSCGGRCLLFGAVSKIVAGAMAYPELAKHSLCSDVPEDRILKHMSNYVPATIYSVCRAEAWCAAAAIISEKEFPVHGSMELQFELAICHQGKTKILPELVWLRSGENITIDQTSPNSSPALNPEVKLCDWWLDPVKQTEKSEFLEIMAKNLVKGDKKKIHNCLNGIEKAVDVYVATQARIFLSLREKIIQSLRVKLVLWLPLSLIRLIRQFMPAKQKLLDIAKELEISGVNVNFEELENICNIILEFHTKVFNDQRT
jgi:glycosyltransferase domain-containing protein